MKGACGQKNHRKKIVGGFLKYTGACTVIFYTCNLRIFVISWSVCPWQALSV
jgi:hypothetical protein